jgi:two-component system chemotaxis response regulator CheB
MAGHDIIVVGGSAGGIEALSQLLAGLPADLPAAVCVTLHQAAHSANRRAQIFSRVSPLPVVNADQGMRLRPGTVYLAVPDMHLLVERSATAEVGRLRLVHGPRENRPRPAFGRRVIGVVLSGALDDGTSGLWVIRDRGGLAVVQDPSDAAVSSMPAHALEEVGADHVSCAADLGPLLAELSLRTIGHQAAPDIEVAHGGNGGSRVQLEAAQEHANAIRSLIRLDRRSGIRPAVPHRRWPPDAEVGGDKYQRVDD